MAHKAPSRSEPVTELRRVPIHECGEPLVDFRTHCPLLLVRKTPFDYEKERLARASVAEMLRQASERMPKGYRLAVSECWRPLHIQRRMYLGVWNSFKEKYPDWSDVKLKRVVNRFTAPLDGRVPPPHSTGGAVDLWVALEDGTICEHTAPFDRFDHHGFAFDAPGLTDEARRNRDMLAEALLPTGLTNYPSEYWHWSYGDQGWAYRGGHPAALFGSTQPPGWTPNPNDVKDEPLVFQTDRAI